MSDTPKENLLEPVDDFNVSLVDIEGLELSLMPSPEGISKNSIALGVFENRIKVVSFAKDSKYSFLDDAQKYHNIFYRSHPETIALQNAIEEFENLLNNSKTGEEKYQEFFERNPEFILNDEYKHAHPHLTLAKIDKERFIPDFVLEPVNQGEFCDLLELKLPSAKTFVMKKSRERFSQEIGDAAAQLRSYRNYFDEEKNRNKFQKIYPHLKIYKPRMFLIIGRQNNENPMIKREIESEHPRLILKNFDQILTRMKYKEEKLKNKLIS